MPESVNENCMKHEKIGTGHQIHQTSAPSPLSATAPSPPTLPAYRHSNPQDPLPNHCNVSHSKKKNPSSKPAMKPTWPARLQCKSWNLGTKLAYWKSAGSMLRGCHHRMLRLRLCCTRRMIRMSLWRYQTRYSGVNSCRCMLQLL